MFTAYAARGFMRILARPPPGRPGFWAGQKEWDRTGYGAVPPPLAFFPHRAAAPFRPIPDSCSRVSLAARAGPPFFPPFRPRATA